MHAQAHCITSIDLSSLLRTFRPEPAGAILLADGLALALADIGENNLPLNVGWAVCVDGADHVHCVLQDFAGAGVKHG
jgi:hypothetical protein